MKKNKYWSRILPLVLTILIISVSTYAWFSDNSNPVIEGSQFLITAAEGLVIVVTPDSPGRLTVDMAQILNSLDSFVLKQVSSQNGIDFFRVEYGQGLTKQNPTYAAIPYQENGTIDMLEYGMIDYDFFLEAGEVDKFIYLHKDTGFFGNGKDAMRFKLTLTLSDNTTYSYIFGETKEDGTGSYPYVTRAVHTGGTFIYGTNPPALVGNQNVFNYFDRNGGRGVSDSDPRDANKMLAELPAGDRLSINLKIWLEGGDPQCTSLISGKTIQGIIKLGSVDNVPTPGSVISGIVAPVIGQTPVTTPINTAQYTGTISWSPIHSPFRAGTVYSATITLTAKEGYTLTGVPANFFTVSGATATNAANSGVITATFPATPSVVNLAAIPGIVAPVTGSTPVTTSINAAQYTGTVTWSPTHSPFRSNTVYTATITLTAKTGYILAGVPANFFTVSGATTTNAVNSGVVTATFPATATTITIAAIPGVVVPVRDATPVTTSINTAQYTGTISWSPADSPFGANTVYTATIILTAKTGYTLVGVTTNYFTVSGATTTTNGANSGVITVIFPATAPIPPPPAPNVTARSGRRITGLTTAMEYYVGTVIPPGATWIAVTNVNLRYTNGQTVNVRYKENPPLPASYSTAVVIYN